VGEFEGRAVQALENGVGFLFAAAHLIEGLITMMSCSTGRR
jgi:hypothetical protein